ncbi:uncharacterized protein LOC133522514 [Cydia pomonella]|uniref:uncharacterized protein LOC133522514 n=1 Tax=Cydia pomonella TaxID=82600 RepID=UPI002ADE3D8A|nr:uncharacterized protein LOC133522514 [Cydia pomonella]
MHFVTLVLFCVLCSFSLVSSKYPLRYKNLRTGEAGDDAIDDDVGVNDDGIVALIGENDSNEGVDDDGDELDSYEGKKLSESNENDAVDDDDNKSVADNDSNDAVDDDDNSVADNHKNDAVDGDDDDNGLSGNDRHDAVDDEFNGFADDDDDGKHGGLFLDDENTAINDSVEGKQEIDDAEPSTLSSSHDNNLSSDELKQYQRELAAGDWSEFLGNNHHHEPRYYKDLSRRFIPVFPYVETNIKHTKPTPEQIIQFIMSKKVLRDNEDRDIVPIKAPADIVVAVMKNGTKKYSSKPSEPTEEVIRQYMLRSGDYWDGVWKEEVKPDTILRTKKKKSQKQTLDIQPFTSKLVPGTKLYDLLARIVKKSPKLLYFINNS